MPATKNVGGLPAAVMGAVTLLPATALLAQNACRAAKKKVTTNPTCVTKTPTSRGYYAICMKEKTIIFPPAGQFFPNLLSAHSPRTKSFLNPPPPHAEACIDSKYG